MSRRILVIDQDGQEVREDLLAVTRDIMVDAVAKISHIILRQCAGQILERFLGPNPREWPPGWRRKPKREAGWRRYPLQRLQEGVPEVSFFMGPHREAGDRVGRREFAKRLRRQMKRHRPHIESLIRRRAIDGAPTTR